VKEEAKQEALQAFREEQQKAADAVKKEEGTLDGMLEDIEDEHDIDLTSKAAEPIRKGFFKLLEKMSPKDGEGRIVAYADHRAVWEEYQSRIKKPDSRAKDISARSMVPSGSSGDSKIADDAATRFLKENGII
jgi:predicted DNA-binding antitoxin AbrB/MazE fold protein